MALLELRELSTDIQLSKSVVHALDHVSFSLEAGETLGLVGESGSGKTMTAMSIERLLPPGGRVVHGQVLFDGMDLVTMPESRLRGIRGGDIGMIFQDPMTSLNPVKSIGDQVAEPLLLHRGMGKKEAYRKVIEMLDMVGVSSPERRVLNFPHQLSGGQRQRVMIAMALICQPKLLIADEPTTALDVTIQKQILELVDSLRHELGMAMILVTHDLGVIAGSADRVVVMYAGKVAETATTATLFFEPKHRYTEALFAALPERAAGTAERLYSIPGLPPDLVDPPRACPFAPRCRFAIEPCRTTVPPMENRHLDDGVQQYACFVPRMTPLTVPEPEVRRAAGGEYVVPAAVGLTGGTVVGAPDGEGAAPALPEGGTPPENAVDTMAGQAPSGQAPSGQAPSGQAPSGGRAAGEAPGQESQPRPARSGRRADRRPAERKSAGRRSAERRPTEAGQPNDKHSWAAPTRFIPADGTPLLQLRGLIKDFPVTQGALLRRKVGAVSAVAGANIVVDRGQTLGLVGESGCGKTTLGRLVVGLEKPTGGDILFRGRKLDRLRGAEAREGRRNVQFMFQDSYASLDPRMRVRQILREPLEIQRVGTGRDRNRRVDELLDDVGLPRRAAERYPHEFSGGQRQRIGLARALALQPALIVADEPVSALDVSVQAQVLNLMKELQRERELTYLFISHDLSVIRYLSDIIAVMYLGKIVEIGPAADLYEVPNHHYTRGLIDTIPIADPVTERQKVKLGVRGELPSAMHPPSGCRFRTRCPAAQDICAKIEPPLQIGGGHEPTPEGAAPALVPLRSADAPSAAAGGTPGARRPIEHLVACHFPLNVTAVANQ